MASSKVADVLATDRAHRQAGVEGDLIPLADLKASSWDYALPTLAKPNRNMEQALQPLVLETRIEMFREALEERVPVLRGLKWDHLLLAGGFVGNVLRREKWSSDLDMFVWGLTPAAASARVAEFIADLFAAQQALADKAAREEKKQSSQRKAKSATFSVRAVRTPHTLSLILDNRTKIQIVFRLYRTKSEILHGFDLGSSAVGYDGTTVWFTSLGKFAYECGCNIVDPSRRSTTYEKRLNKYFQRGFEVVLPDLDLTTVRQQYLPYRQNEMLLLPYLPVVYNEVQGNRITVRDLPHPTVKHSSGETTSDHDYGDDLNQYGAFYVNVCNVVKGSDYLYHYMEWSHATADDARQVLLSPPYLSRRSLVQFYDALPEQILHRGRFNYTRLFQCLNGPGASADLAAALFQQPTTAEKRQFIQRLVEQQKERMLQACDAIAQKDYSQINWRVDDPGGQVTASFNPVLSHPADWYGPHVLQATKDSKTHFPPHPGPSQPSSNSTQSS